MDSFAFEHDNYASEGYGGCFRMSAGELRLRNVSIEHCNATQSGSILYVPPGQQGAITQPLLLATMVSFHQRDCDTALFLQDAPTQLVLRRIAFHALPGCNTENAQWIAGHPAKGCSEQYTLLDGQECGVCTQPSAGRGGASAECTSTLLPGTAIASLECACVAPNFADPTEGDMAPFLPSNGCIEPMQMDPDRTLSVVSSKVTVVLEKPGRMLQSLNVTLHL